MIYKNVSVKQVIAKVFADLDLQEGTHRVSDMVEWCGEAIERIGAFPSFEINVTGLNDVPLLILSNYQAQLPANFHKLIQVEYSSSKSGPFYPMRYGTGSYTNLGELTTSTDTSVEAVVAESDLVTLAMDIYNLSYEDALNKINTDPDVKATLTAIINTQTYSSPNSIGDGAVDNTYDYTYIVVGNYIKTNIKDGYLLVSYQAIPTDSEGYPLVPDDASYLEALYWYIVMKLTYPDWRAGHVRDAVYYDARRSWNYYSKQAYANAIMPNRDQMESIKNTWLRLIPEIHEHSTGFSTVGQRQIVYNQTND